jgi:hypothetical protein
MPTPPQNQIELPPIGATTVQRALLWAQQFIPAHVGTIDDVAHYPVERVACLTDEDYPRPHLWAGWRYVCSCGKSYDVRWVGETGLGLDLFQTDHASLEIALLQAAGQPVS